jgi:hypothetical protein
MLALPKLWMQRVCSGSVPSVLGLYRKGAVLVPTYSKRDLPGAGTGALKGHAQLVNYFNRFLSKKNLCGTIDTMVVQRKGPMNIYSGLYTFRWMEGGKRKTAKARYNFVTSRVNVMGVPTEFIVNHHSSAQPGSDALDGFLGAAVDSDTRQAIQMHPDYWIQWYTAKSLALVVAVGAVGYLLGRRQQIINHNSSETP